FSTQQQGKQAAFQQHCEGEDKVHRADVLVVGGKDPAAPAFFRAVVRVVVIVSGRWYVTGGNAAHAWLLPAGPHPGGAGRILVILLPAPRWALALGRDVGGLDNRVFTLALMPPGVARISNDRCNFDIVENVAERRHGSAGPAVQYDVDLILHGREHKPFVLYQGGERGRHTLPVCLVAGQAGGGIDFLAASHEFFQFVGLGGIVGGGLHGLHLFGGPLLVFGLFLDFDHDRHERVVFTAKLCTLPAIDAGLFGAEPGVAQHARHGVLLHAEIRHHP